MPGTVTRFGPLPKTTSSSDTSLRTYAVGERAFRFNIRLCYVPYTQHVLRFNDFSYSRGISAHHTPSETPSHTHHQSRFASTTHTPWPGDAERCLHLCRPAPANRRLTERGRHQHCPENPPKGDDAAGSNDWTADFRVPAKPRGTDGISMPVRRTAPRCGAPAVVWEGSVG